MNTLIFLGGLGTGAVITAILFLVVVNWLARSRSKETERIHECNEASVEELKRRNDIGEREASSLQKIADWCENNWDRTAP